jgi:hypothetical protein
LQAGKRLYRKRPIADFGFERQTERMASMLSAVLISFLLAMGVGRFVARVAQRSGIWPIATFVAVLPSVIIAVGMQFATQMIAWGLLILIPTAAAWLIGCLAGLALSTRTERNAR